MIKRLILGFLSLSMVVVAGLQIRADFIDDNASNPPVVSRYGSKLFPNSGISYGTNPGDISSDFVPCMSDVAIAVGDCVVLDTATTFLVSVSETTTSADPTFFGIAATGVTASGKVLLVRTRGICRANVPVLNISKGAILTTSGTAGQLTTVASSSALFPSALSYTAVAGSAVETLNGGPQILMFQRR